VEHPEVRSAIELLEAWIDAQRVARNLPGLSVGIVHDQALLWSSGLGWADVARYGDSEQPPNLPGRQGGGRGQ
jgi:hypothetical protein